MSDVVERLRSWIDNETKKGEGLGIENYRGDDFYYLTYEEETVFQIRLKDMPKLVTVYGAFSELLGIEQGELYETPLCKKAQKELDWIEHDKFSFQRFAALFGISNRLAEAFYRKVEFWEVRNDLVTYNDETEEEEKEESPIDLPNFEPASSYLREEQQEMFPPPPDDDIPF